MSTDDDDYHKQRAEAEGCTVEEAKERTLRDLEHCERSKDNPNRGPVVLGIEALARWFSS